MAESVVAKALSRLERAWDDLCNAHVEISPDEFEKKIRSMNKRCGITHSDLWIQAARKALEQTTRMNDTQARNIILAECGPPQLKKIMERLDRALLVLVGTAEFAYEELDAFVKDPAKDARLRHFVWYRAYLAAEAHREAGKLLAEGKETGIGKMMPHIAFRETAG